MRHQPSCLWMLFGSFTDLLIQVIDRFLQPRE